MIATNQVGSVGQKRLVIVGATGMVGGYALGYALEDSPVGAVTSIGRKKLGMSHPKLTQVLHSDFADCSARSEALSGQDAAVFCLGVYTGAVPDGELRKMTVDYTVEFARVLRSSSPDAAFSFLSGSGADPTGRSRMPFARYKGEAEKALLAEGFHSVASSARVYLSCEAAEGAEFELLPVARDLPRVSGAISQPGDSRRRSRPGHGECRHKRHGEARRFGFREPRHPGHGRVAPAVPTPFACFWIKLLGASTSKSSFEIVRLVKIGN